MRGAVLAAVLSLWMAPAYSATHNPQPFIPGGSPCNGACTQEWATEFADVPDGELEPVILHPGDLIYWMSYARDGVPYYSTNTMEVATEIPLTGVGYTFERAGVKYLFVKIAACQNWAVVLRNPIPPSSLFDVPVPSESIFEANSTVFSSPFSDFGLITSSIFTTTVITETVTDIIREPCNCGDISPEIPAPIPVPASVLLYITGILGLTAFMRRRYRHV